MEEFIKDLQIPKAGRVTALNLALDHWLRGVDTSSNQQQSIVVECGVFQGESIRHIAGRLPDTQSIFGFDSFKGLPEAWDRGDTNQYCTGKFSLEGEMPQGLPRNITLVPGWFQETLPEFAETQLAMGRWISLLHVDCDIYSSTKTVMHALAPLFREGTLIVFDELINYPGYERHELKAFYEFLMPEDPDKKVWDVEWVGTLGEFIRDPIRQSCNTQQSVACRLITSK